MAPFNGSLTLANLFDEGILVIVPPNTHTHTHTLCTDYSLIHMLTHSFFLPLLSSLPICTLCYFLHYPLLPLKR